MFRPFQTAPLPTILATAFAAALGLAPAIATAQDAAQDTATGHFELQLNTVEDIADTCRLTYVALNNTGTVLEQTAYDVVVFDADGAVTSRLILEFGRLPEGKTKVVQFDIAGGGCASISRLLLNDVEQCETTAGPVTSCIDGLVTSSRVNTIEFGA